MSMHELIGVVNTSTIADSVPPSMPGATNDAWDDEERDRPFVAPMLFATGLKNQKAMWGVR